MAIDPFFGQIAGPILGGVLGKNSGPSRGDVRKQQYRQQKFTMQQIQLGNQMDLANQKEMMRHRLETGFSHGLTAYEMFMGPTASAGGGTSGSGQVLGNAANSQGMQQRQLDQDRQLAWQSKLADISTELLKTKMQTETQKEVAGVSAGASRYAADTQAAIAEGRLQLDRDTYKFINLPAAAANLKKSEQEIAKLVNEVATSDKEFVVMMKQLSMGADNMLVEYFSRHHGINLSDPESFTRLPKDKREALLTAMIALKSSSATEARGLSSVLGDAGIDLWNRVFGGEDEDEGIELTPGANQALNAAVLGNKTPEGGKPPTRRWKRWKR